VAEDSASSRQDGGLSKLDCFIRFDEVHYWLSRTRDLITNAETYAYPAFRESFRELRREARKSEMELVIALFRFERAINKAMAESKS
jgi:arginyl-tRNA synthetase